MMKISRLFLLCTAISVGVNGSILFGQDNEAVATAVRAPAASVPKMGPLTVTVDLLGGQKITGTLTEMTDLPFRASLGEVKIPLAQVAGIKLASGDDPSTTIIFKNGDSITGATDLQSVSVDTEWGSAKINGSSITSLILLPDLKWNASIGLNGKRWSLVDSKNVSTSQPAGAPPSVNSQPNSVLPRTVPLQGTPR